MFLDGVGIGFLAEAGIGEVADRQGFQVGRFADGDAEMAVVELCFDGDLSILDGGEDHAAGPVLGKPAGDHAIAGGRIGAGEEEIAARMLVRQGQSGRSHRPQFLGRLAEINLEAYRSQPLDVGQLLAIVLLFLLDQQERQIAIQFQPGFRPIRLGDDDRLAWTTKTRDVNHPEDRLAAAAFHPPVL